MNDTLERRLASCSALLQLELEARRAASRAELEFFMVNRILALLPTASCLFWRPEGVQRVSAVSRLDGNAPFVRWAAVLGKTLVSAPRGGALSWGFRRRSLRGNRPGVVRFRPGPRFVGPGDRRRSGRRSGFDGGADGG